MAEQETINKPKDLIEATPEELQKLEQAMPEVYKSREERAKEEEKRKLDSWVPKTNLGRLVRTGKIKNISEVLSQDKKILESEIVDLLLKLDFDLLSIGQAKGKFGGGKRRAWRQTQKKTMEGNVVTFSAMAVVGDKKGHVGVGYGRSKETLPARAKAVRQAKLGLIKINRGFESIEHSGNEPQDWKMARI